MDGSHSTDSLGAAGLPPSRTKSFGKTGMRIIIKDLDYSVMSSFEKGKEIFLLSKVSASFEPRQMSALMGPSGSGKTTLLDLLAGRKTVGKTEGTLLYGGNKPSVQFLRRYTGYVEQFDTLIGLLTVREMLMYTADLKRPITEPMSSKATAVEELIQKLGLETCRDVKIGSALSKGISGGQAKRVNIGIALVSNPRILFLDEPTSGLDSYTANEVMTVVRDLLSYNVTVVATIHSPTQYAFNLFDKLLMLVRGKVVYYGERGPAALEYVKPIVASAGSDAAYNGNDAEYLVDLFTEADRNGRGHVYADAYQASELKKANNAELQQFLEEKVELSDETKAELAVKRATVTPSWWGLRTYLKYRTTRNYRDPAFLGPRIGDKILMGLIIMSLFWGIGNNFSSTNIFNICAVLFLWCTLPAFGAAAYVPAIFLERPLFIRERNDGLYRTITYLCAKMLDEILITVAGSLLIAIMVYFGVHLQGNFALFWLVYLTILCIGISTAYTFAALAPSIDVANAIVPFIMVVMLFFAGFLIRIDDLPPWWAWFGWLDFIRYGWAALVLNEFGGQNVEVFGPGSPVVEEYFGMSKASSWGYWGICLAFVPFCIFCAWLALAFKRHEKR